jgi:hypothetical protein
VPPSNRYAYRAFIAVAGHHVELGRILPPTVKFRRQRIARLRILFQKRDLRLRSEGVNASAAPIEIASAFILCAIVFP